MGRPGGDDLPFVYSGTLVVQGQGIAEVHATGAHTEIGKIGKALQTVEPEDTLCSRKPAAWCATWPSSACRLCALVVVDLRRRPAADWLDGLLAGITLAMAMLPEEFPVVLTIFLALGAWRISQKQVLTRRMPAIETLGAATVLCVDKTGTLTLNRMTVAQLSRAGEFCDLRQPRRRTLPEKFHALVEFGILASQRDPFDPMEKAIHQVGDQYLAAHRTSARRLDADPGISAVQELAGPVARVAVARRAGLRYRRQGRAGGHCRSVPPHPGANSRSSCRASRAMAERRPARAGRGARRGFSTAGPAGRTARFRLRVHRPDRVWPTRSAPRVPAAIQECQTAGIRVVMITGDYPGTAQNIARQIGLTPHDQVITGPELDQMDDEELRRRIAQRQHLCARGAGAETAPRQCPEGQRRNRGHDGRRRQRRAGAQSGAHRHRDGRTRHRRGPRILRPGAARRRLLIDRAGRPPGPPHLSTTSRKPMAYIFAVHVPIAGLLADPGALQACR